ncbi:sodium/hydrogen exchanger 9B2 isoform X2 [Nylanderia fulva]|uniref:sodium/hydrogen exchanger 9B2 isoform X2 n=1 Tax=Nylanderia fulva TaxID=613905 RepID=UPI0010FB2407|nr:sodium/hydrogen exchanger 9B2 isoform X2 [Nylanderia fulva]
MEIDMSARTNKPTEELAKRRVSISDQVLGIDNPAFEHHRRISASSEHNSDQGRRKSILHHGSSHCDENIPENIPQYKFDLENGRINGNRKKSAYSLSSSIRDKIEYSEELKRSWLYLFCARCHGRDDTPSWEPPGWKKACPQPFCPTYRKFARVLCLFLLGLLLWGVVYSVIGNDAAPGGQLFGLAALCIAAHFGGWLISLTTLPALIGMLITGLILQNVGLVKIEGQYSVVVANLRKIALVIILTRAGLDLDPTALRKLRVTVPKMGLIPWLVEATVVAVLTRFLLNLPWVWGFLLGSIIAAVSPAVVVPCLFRLRAKGYGVAKPFLVPLRVLMLLGGGLLAVFGSEAIELGGAGPLAVVAAAFVSCYFWQQEGWEVDDNPVATSFEIFWMIFEPILFGVTGAQIKISELEGKTVYLGLGCLLSGIVIRIGATVLCGIGSKLNLKEKVFIALSWMAKATVQAALGPVTLDEVDRDNPHEVEYAEMVLMLCVLSVLLTAPAGAIIISLSGPKLLTKTSAPVALPEAWKSRRPSIRDISIINEDPDLEETANERKP